jgi:hypothetical protein
MQATHILRWTDLGGSVNFEIIAGLSQFQGEELGMKSAGRSFNRSAPGFQRRISGKVPTRPARHAVDVEKLLHLSRQLYAHSLTLQEVIRNEGEIPYEALRPRFDRQAAQQFELFYHSSKRLSESRTRSAACE